MLAYCLGIKHNIITLSKIDIFHIRKKKMCLRLVRVNITEWIYGRVNVRNISSTKRPTQTDDVAQHHINEVSHIFLLVLSILIPKFQYQHNFHTMKQEWKVVCVCNKIFIQTNTLAVWIDQTFSVFVT